MVGQTDQQCDRRRVGHMKEWTNRQKVGQTDRQCDRRTDGKGWTRKQ